MRCGTALTENFFISALNPYNPFGVDLSVANGNFEFYGRRPWNQGRASLTRTWTLIRLLPVWTANSAADRVYYWDLYATYAENRGFQQKRGAHNGANLQIAVGDPAICASVPGCVPFNLFGGQGPNGEGSITQEMLDFVGAVQRDFSEQNLVNFGGNITGSIMDMTAGSLAFAAGFEYREHEGSFQPDQLASSGNTLGIPSGRSQRQIRCHRVLR